MLNPKLLSSTNISISNINNQLQQKLQNQYYQQNIISSTKEQIQNIIDNRNNINGLSITINSSFLGNIITTHEINNELPIPQHEVIQQQQKMREESNQNPQEIQEQILLPLSLSQFKKSSTYILPNTSSYPCNPNNLPNNNKVIINNLTMITTSSSEETGLIYKPNLSGSTHILPDTNNNKTKDINQKNNFINDCMFCQRQLLSDNNFIRPKSFKFMIYRALYSKYASSQNYYYTRDLNEILNNNRTSAVILYKDYEAYDDDDEYLKRYYILNEYDNKINMLTEYYKFHKDIPRLFMLPTCTILNKYHDRKRRIEYIRITKMLKEEGKYNDDNDIIIENNNNNNEEIIPMPIQDRILDNLEFTNITTASQQQQYNNNGDQNSKENNLDIKITTSNEKIRGNEYGRKNVKDNSKIRNNNELQRKENHSRSNEIDDGQKKTHNHHHHDIKTNKDEKLTDDSVSNTLQELNNKLSEIISTSCIYTNNIDGVYLDTNEGINTPKNQHENNFSNQQDFLNFLKSCSGLNQNMEAKSATNKYNVGSISARAPLNDIVFDIKPHTMLSKGIDEKNQNRALFKSNNKIASTSNTNAHANVHANTNTNTINNTNTITNTNTNTNKQPNENLKISLANIPTISPSLINQYISNNKEDNQLTPQIGSNRKVSQNTNHIINIQSISQTISANQSPNNFQKITKSRKVSTNALGNNELSPSRRKITNNQPGVNLKTGTCLGQSNQGKQLSTKIKNFEEALAYRGGIGTQSSHRSQKSSRETSQKRLFTWSQQYQNSGGKGMIQSANIGNKVQNGDHNKILSLSKNLNKNQTKNYPHTARSSSIKPLGNFNETVNLSSKNTKVIKGNMDITPNIQINDPNVLNLMNKESTNFDYGICKGSSNKDYVSGTLQSKYPIKPGNLKDISTGYIIESNHDINNINPVNDDDVSFERERIMHTIMKRVEDLVYEQKLKAEKSYHPRNNSCTASLNQIKANTNIYPSHINANNNNNNNQVNQFISSNIGMNLPLDKIINNTDSAQKGIIKSILKNRTQNNSPIMLKNNVKRYSIGVSNQGFYNALNITVNENPKENFIEKNSQNRPDSNYKKQLSHHNHTKSEPKIIKEFPLAINLKDYIDHDKSNYNQTTKIQFNSNSRIGLIDPTLKKQRNSLPNTKLQMLQMNKDKELNHDYSSSLSQRIISNNIKHMIGESTAGLGSISAGDSRKNSAQTSHSPLKVIYKVIGGGGDDTDRIYIPSSKASMFDIQNQKKLVKSSYLKAKAHPNIKSTNTVGMEKFNISKKTGNNNNGKGFSKKMADEIYEIYIKIKKANANLK